MAISQPLFTFIRVLLCFQILFSGCLRCFIESRLMMSPSGVASLCPGDNLTFTCSTNRTFLEWNITTHMHESRTRLISSDTMVSSVAPLVLNSIMRSFTISFSAEESSAPLVSYLLVANATIDLNGTRVLCKDIGASLAETSVSVATIHVIRISDINSLISTVTQVSNFGIDNIFITLSWIEREIKVSYKVNIVPQATMRLIQGSGSEIINLQLTVLYNTQYVVKIVGTLCGQNISSTTVELNYVKCENLLRHLGSDDGTIQVSGYSDPALVGTNVTLECSLPNLVFIGPNRTACMRSGEWEPDPSEVKCVADCGPPMIDSGLNLTYNSTLEGSRVVVWCDGFVATASCHRNGSWSTHLTNSVCNFTSPSITMATESEATAMIVTTADIIIIIIVVISVVALFIFNIIIVCVCFYLKYKRSSKTSSGDVQLSQSSHPVYETVMGGTSEIVDPKMTENVAYAPIRSTRT